MSARTTIGLTIGVLIIMLVSSSINVYYTKTAKDTTEENKRLVLEGRQIGNKRGNQTLGAVGEVIKEVKTISLEIRENLTQHRHIANITRDNSVATLKHIEELLNQTQKLINTTGALTGPQYSKLADIRVQNIIGNLSADHDQLHREHSILKKDIDNMNSSTIGN